MGFCNRLVHLVGVVLGDFPAAVVAMANRPGIEKSRHSISTPARLTRVSTNKRSWKVEFDYLEQQQSNSSKLYHKQPCLCPGNTCSISKTVKGMEVRYSMVSVLSAKAGTH